MGRIIRFEPDRHRETQTLLPWYVTGRLEEDERASVEAHLRDCPECQAELRLERRLAAEIAELPVEADGAWAALNSRITAEEAAPPPLARLRGALARPWAIAAQFVLVTAALGLVLPLARPQAPTQAPAPAPAYHALGAPPPHPAGDLLVIFRPDARSADLTRALRATNARLVDGPTAANAYVLDVPLAERAVALERLRADAAVSLAEPVDPTERP
jgi:anti-sigma factor RsiW